MTDVTRILNAIEQGDPRATEDLLPLIYDELRLLASQKLAKEPPGQTLQATALVHEAYIRLVGGDQNWTSRGHFLKAAAEAMRRILVENARRKQRIKRGGDRQKVNLEGANVTFESPSEDIIAVNEALNKLAEEEPVVADLVKLWYFAGFTLEQTAGILGISRRTAHRYWDYARAWLHQEITKGQTRFSGSQEL